VKDDPVLFEHIGDVNETMGNDKAALDAWEKSLKYHEKKRESRSGSKRRLRNSGRNERANDRTFRIIRKVPLYDYAQAPAKINWSLYVLDRRDDGYHNILSLMQCIGLYDTMTFEQASAIEFQSDMRIPKEMNLVFRAAIALREAAGKDLGARIVLRKKFRLVQVWAEEAVMRPLHS